MFDYFKIILSKNKKKIIFTVKTRNSLDENKSIHSTQRHSDFIKLASMRVRWSDESGNNGF